MVKRYVLLVLYPNHLSGYGVGHAALSIVDGMNGSGFKCVLTVPSANSSINPKSIRKIFSGITLKFIYKLFSQQLVQTLTELLFFYQIKPNDIVYLWPDASIKLMRKIKAKGNLIVIENINCHQKLSKAILDDEAARLKLEHAHQVSQANIDFETEKLRLCDFVFSPSPMVTDSLQKADVPKEKILESNYGLNKQQQVDKLLPTKFKKNTIEVIFVGRVCMRKGIHLILEYWQAANINGRLKIIGNIEANIRDLISGYYADVSIEFVDFVADIEQVFKTADVFVLPSLEEGSPLVTYLALGAGLPCVVSPMGGQGVVTDGHDGFILDPHDKSAWVDALQNLASSPTLREELSYAARSSSDRFLWETVGQQRAGLLLEKLQGK